VKSGQELRTSRTCLLCNLQSKAIIYSVIVVDVVVVVVVAGRWLKMIVQISNAPYNQAKSLLEGWAFAFISRNYTMHVFAFTQTYARGIT